MSTQVPQSLQQALQLVQAFIQQYGSQAPSSLQALYQQLLSDRSSYISLLNNQGSGITDPRVQNELSNAEAQYQQALTSVIQGYAQQFGTSDPTIATAYQSFIQANPGVQPVTQAQTPAPTANSGLSFNFGAPLDTLPPSGGSQAVTSTTPPSTANPYGINWASGSPAMQLLSGTGGSQQTQSTAPPPNGVSGTGDQQVLNETIDGVTYSLSFNTAQDIINSALQTVGLDPSALASTGINAGQTLGNFFWSQIVNQGITDPTTIGDMIGTLLPSTGQFQVAFPGYQEALKNGYVRTVAEYVSAEEGITAVMLQGGVPKDLINSTTVGNLISNGVSVNEVAARVQNGLDAALNAPAEVQNYFAQEFGAGQGPAALATVFLNPNIDAVTLQKMLAGAQIRGAAAASNLTISQGLSQRLADQGQTYASAQSQFKNLTAQAGLFQQTVGEQSSQAPVPGTQNANMPLSESQQGVEAAFGMNSNAVQQVHQAALARQNAFRGGGGASTSQTEGYSGLSESKPF